MKFSSVNHKYWHFRILGFVALICLAPVKSLNAASSKDIEVPMLSQTSGWEVVDIANQVEDGPAVLTFKENKKNGILRDAHQAQVLDDDGVISLATIQFSIMQKYSKAMMYDNLSWDSVKSQNEPEFPRFKASILASLKRLMKYGTNEVAALREEINSLQKELTALKKLPVTAENNVKLKNLQEKIAEIVRNQSILANELEYSKDAYVYFSKVENVSVGILNESLGRFLSKVAKEHFYQVLNENGELKTVSLLAPSARDSFPLAKVLQSRPLYIDGSKKLLPDFKQKFNVSFATNVFQPKSSESFVHPTDVQTHGDSDSDPEAIRRHIQKGRK